MDVKIGDKTLPGRLPWIPRMVGISSAHQLALGLRFDAAGNVVKGDDGLPAYIDQDEDAVALIAAAAVGMSLQIPTEVEPYHRHASIMDYGDAVLRELVEAGHDIQDVYNAGQLLIVEFYKSIPKGPAAEAVKTHKDFSETESGDGSSMGSGSASNDVETPFSGSD